MLVLAYRVIFISLLILAHVRIVAMIVCGMLFAAVLMLAAATSGVATPPRATAALRLAAAEEVATKLTGQQPLNLAHARHRPPPKPEYLAPTPECPAELARQVNVTGLLPVDMFGNDTTTDDDRVRLAINASRVCGGAIFFLSTPGHISYQFATTVDVPANIVFQGGGWNGVAQFQTPSMAEIGVSAQALQCGRTLAAPSLSLLCPAATLQHQ